MKTQAWPLRHQGESRSEYRRPSASPPSGFFRQLNPSTNALIDHTAEHDYHASATPALVQDFVERGSLRVATPEEFRRDFTISSGTAGQGKKARHR